MKQDKRTFMFLLFTALYFVQGVIQAYQLNFFKPHMADAGIEPDRIGLVASLALVPFIIKSIFGFVSDRVNLFGLGHRKPYLFIGIIGCALAFFIAYFVDPAINYGTVALMVVTATFFMALFDTTADAYAVDTTSEADMSRVQAFMTGGRAAGLIVLSFVFGRIAVSYGYNAIFLVIALCLLIPLAFVSRINEPAQRDRTNAFDRSAFRIMLKPAVLLFCLFLIISATMFQGIDGLVTLYMSEGLGANPAVIGNYGTLKGVGMVVGAVGASYLANLIGQRNASLLTLALVTSGGLIFSRSTSAELIVWLGVIWGIAVGFHWTVYAAVSMRITDPRVAGTMFALLQTMTNIGFGVGDGLTASLTDDFAFSQVFRIFALGNVVAVPILIAAFYFFKTLTFPRSAPATVGN